jgi:microcystin-dependent protein
MSDCFVGEVRAICCTFAPVGWLICNGDIFPVSKYPQLAAVLKDTYGGDGVNTFGVPNFNGRTAIGTGQGAGLTERKLNDMVGTPSETLTAEQMPAHSHNVRAVSKASSSAFSSNPEGNVWAKSMLDTYSTEAPNTALDALAISPSQDKGLTHNNIQPSMCLNYIIDFEQGDVDLEYYMGEIRMFAGLTPPVGWHLCDGSLINIAEYPELFQLLGTRYGGDGVATFCLPDLCGRTAIGSSETVPLGAKGGSETVTLSVAEIPTHSHTVKATGQNGTSSVPGENMLWANGGTAQPYASGAADSTLSAAALTTAGGGAAHNNMMPSLSINYMIGLNGADPRAQ